MGLTRWFRRRPPDDEMREELEAHVAMRAEHDRVDEAAARRRLGNTLRTREAMRRVWIAEWWDALQQDAWFTWTGTEWQQERHAGDTPVIRHPHFTGTGTRSLKPNGRRAIDDLFNRSFGAAS